MSVSIERHLPQHIAILRFSNPPLNYATVGLLAEIADALELLDQDEEVRVVVLIAEGKVFCAGADLVSENGFGANSDDPLREFYDQVLRLFATQKPIVAAVQGAAIGAGLGLAIAADFRVASPDARFSANFAALGFHPGFGLTRTLPRLVGHQKAALMMLNAKRYKAEEVMEWGMIDVMSTKETLEVDAFQFAVDIAMNAPLSLLATRATLRGELLAAVTSALVREHSEQLKLQNTDDFAEGIRAVGERRLGNFRGK